MAVTASYMQSPKQKTTAVPRPGTTPGSTGAGMPGATPPPNQPRPGSTPGATTLTLPGQGSQQRPGGTPIMGGGQGRVAPNLSPGQMPRGPQSTLPGGTRGMGGGGPLQGGPGPQMTPTGNTSTDYLGGGGGNRMGQSQMALGGGQPGTQDYSNMNQFRFGPTPGNWNPPTPPQFQFQPGTPIPPGAGNVGNQFGGIGGLWDPAKYGGEGNINHIPNMLGSLLPLSQFQQNQFQYGQDFNEAMRRYNMEFQRNQGRDQFDMGLAGRQQQMAEWQAQQQRQQWQQQFGHTRFMDQSGLQLAGQQIGLQGREIDNTRLYQQGLLQNQGNLNESQRQYWQGQIGNERQDIANRLQLGQFGNQTERMNIENQYRLGQGQLQNTQFGNQTERMNVNNQFQLGQGQLQNQQFGNQTERMVGLGQLRNDQFGNQTQRLQANQQYQLGNRANQIDEMFRRGQLSNEQRNLALQELTQQQSNTFQYAQMQQQAQQAEMERQNALQLANIGAYGRSVAPQTTSWARSWS